MLIQPEVIEERLTHELRLLDDTDPLKRYTAAAGAIEKAIEQLKIFLQSHEFSSEGEEIKFFKETRPAILARKIEEGLRYNLAINVPIGTAAAQIRYFEEAIRGLQSFFRLNAFYYQYYKNQFKELDSLYFKRASGPLQIPLPEITGFDTTYSTAVSDLFAKFMAYEAVQHYITQEQNYISFVPQDHPSPANADTELRWTGETVNFVEIAYGLWLTGQFNNGNANLNQIVRELELQWGIKVGMHRRTFAEIGRRKRLSITHFIDQMKTALIQRVESSDS